MRAAIAGMSRWRFMLQDLLGNFVPPLKRTEAWWPNLIGILIGILKEEHPERTVPDYATFFRERQDARYRGGSGTHDGRRAITGRA